MTLFDPSDTPVHTAASPARRILVVEADGGSLGNPGHSGYGALVRDPDTGEILVEKAEYLGIVSNNVAEYSGLIAALELAHEIDPDAWILAKMDSKLVVEQMSGRWKIKHADMQRLAAQARKIVDPHRVKYQWIPREINKDADRLSNEAMDAGIAGVPWKPRELKGKTAASSEGRAQAAPAREAAAQEPADAGQVPSDRSAATGRLHHVEIWVRDFPQA